MFNILPEEMRGRLWPYVTLTIIVLNAFLFLTLHDRVQRERRQLAELESRNLRLAAAYPKTPMNQAQQVLVDAFQHDRPDEWNRLASADRKPLDVWESSLREEKPEEIQHEMAELGQELGKFQRESVLAQYTFYPPRRAVWSYVTANFLHDSWMPLAFNLLFLWLAGAALEDVWGRAIYAAFYLGACLGAVGIYSLLHATAAPSLIGASGTVAALMGALLVRFPKTRVQRGTGYWSVRPKLFRFKSPVYVVLPLWLLGQVVWVRLVGHTTDVEYGTQIAAFVLGAMLSVLLRITTVDHHVDQAIDTKVGGWSADPHIVKAGEYLEKGLLDAAIAELKAQIEEKPASAEAYEMLPGIYQRKGATFLYLVALEAVCKVHIETHRFEAAWQDYEDYCAAQGQGMPAATWLELCHIVEGQPDWERAAKEYEELARTWPEDRGSVLALISAGRLQLRLGRPEKAKELYIAAQKSPVPHQDWEESIRKGLERADLRIKSKSEPATPTRAPSKP